LGFITEIEDSKNIPEVVDTVKTITIDDILVTIILNIWFVKIDIEGGEKQLFVIMKTGYPKRNVSLLNYMMEVLKELKASLKL
jgi:hypothetical protein